MKKILTIVNILLTLIATAGLFIFQAVPNDLQSITVGIIIVAAGLEVGIFLPLHLFGNIQRNYLDIYNAPWFKNDPASRKEAIKKEGYIAGMIIMAIWLLAGMVGWIYEFLNIIAFFQTK